jgi:prevent-host-death family protein
MTESCTRSDDDFAPILRSDLSRFEDARVKMGTDTWTVAEAKAKFSEVIDRAHSKGPQVVTRSGRKSVVVVAAEEWERKTKRVGNLAEFFASSPLSGSGLRVKRSKDGPRKVKL